MILTEKQEQGVKIAIERYKNGEKYTTIGGYAGTGKSTLVRFMVEILGVPEDDICFTAFTGKAANVLLKKGNKNVRTLHKLLYVSHLKSDGTFIRVPVKEIPYKIIIIDEISMVPLTMIKLLFTYNVHVICLGDPFQLPPINQNEDNHLLDNTHIFLDEIMRQEQESEIIRLTMDIREGKEIKVSQGKEVIILNKNELNTGMLKWADQILCGTNATRTKLNSQMRKLNNIFEDKPQDKDKMICLTNYWDIISTNEEPLMNGTIGYLSNSFETFFTIPRRLGLEKREIPIIHGDFIVNDDDNIFSNLDMDKNMIIKGENTLDSKTSYILSKIPSTRNLIPMNFTYGYAITCHKAQGSEWEKVLVVEENFPRKKEEHARWLYTACTRASSRLVLVKEGNK